MPNIVRIILKIVNIVVSFAMSTTTVLLLKSCLTDYLYVQRGRYAIGGEHALYLSIMLFGTYALFRIFNKIVIHDKTKPSIFV